MLHETHMKRAEIEKWITALRDPSNEQCRGHYTDSGKCCAVGLLCRVFHINPMDTSTYIPLDVKTKVIWMNDTEQRSFEHIANYVEREVLPRCES